MEFNYIVNNGKWYDFYGAVEDQFKINDMIFLVLEGILSFIFAIGQIK